MSSRPAWAKRFANGFFSTTIQPMHTILGDLMTVEPASNLGVNMNDIVITADDVNNNTPFAFLHNRYRMATPFKILGIPFDTVERAYCASYVTMAIRESWYTPYRQINPNILLMEYLKTLQSCPTELLASTTSKLAYNNGLGDIDARYSLDTRWRQARIGVMRFLLRHKFMQNPELTVRLCCTGWSGFLVGKVTEHNTPGASQHYWEDKIEISRGTLVSSRGTGQLGNLLRELREQLISSNMHLYAAEELRRLNNSIHAHCLDSYPQTMPAIEEE